MATNNDPSYLYAEIKRLQAKMGSGFDLDITYKIAKLQKRLGASAPDLSSESGLGGTDLWQQYTSRQCPTCRNFTCQCGGPKIPKTRTQVKPMPWERTRSSAPASHYRSRQAGSSFVSFPDVSLPPLALPSEDDMLKARGLTDLKPELNWSASRARLFESDREGYFRKHYAMWGGWDEKAPKSVRDVYQRKYMKNASMWIGTEVHQQIEETVKAIAGDPMNPINPALRRIETQSSEVPSATSESLKMAARMKERYAESAAGLHVRRPKGILRLMEHEAGTASQDLLANSQREAVKHYLSFRKSRWHGMLMQVRNAENKKKHQYLKVIAADEMQKFDVGGVDVWAGPDLVVQRTSGPEAGGRTRTFIVDWKTGNMDAEDLKKYTHQLNAYALWAQKERNIDPKDMYLVLAHMQGGKLKETVRKVNAADLQDTEQYIINSARAMRDGLGPEGNANTLDFVTPEKYVRAQMPRVGVSDAAENIAHARSSALKNAISKSKQSATIENMWSAIPTKAKLGGGLAGMAILGWWMFRDSHQRSKRGDPRSRGYGWSPADAKIHPGMSTTRMMYEGGGFGGIA